MSYTNQLRSFGHWDLSDLFEKINGFKRLQNNKREEIK